MTTDLVSVTKYGVETDENGRHSTSRSFWLEHLELVFLNILSVEIAGVFNVAKTVEASSVAGDTASLTEKLLGDVETVILGLGVGGVWVAYLYRGTVNSVVILLCRTSDRNVILILILEILISGKNLMKALVDRDRE